MLSHNTHPLLVRATQLGIGIGVGQSGFLYANDNHQQLRVGPVRSPAELEDLWAIDNAAYGQALLEGFKFFRIQNAAAMPDHVPLFGLELEHREQLIRVPASLLPKLLIRSRQGPL